MKLVDIANQLNLTFKGDGNINVLHFCSLENPKKNAISYVKNTKYLQLLNKIQLAAVILSPEIASNYHSNCIIHKDPYYAFSQVSRLLSPDVRPTNLIHQTAVIASSATIANDVVIGANCVIEANAVIGANTTIQSGCVVGRDTTIGENSYLFPSVTINHNCEVGDDVRIQSGAVIGSEGFGYAKVTDGWSRIAHTGKVIIGNKVEIGANTTIDRGTIDNTVIEEGVILDNLIQIAHNVKVGKNTAMASGVGVAGSAIIGEDCTFGGCAVVLGHLNIADNVHITSQSLVTKSINEAGQYSSGGLLQKSSIWRKNAVRFKQLNELFLKVSKL